VTGSSRRKRDEPLVPGVDLEVRRPAGREVDDGCEHVDHRATLRDLGVFPVLVFRVDGRFVGKLGAVGGGGRHVHHAAEVAPRVRLGFKFHRASRGREHRRIGKTAAVADVHFAMPEDQRVGGAAREEDPLMSVSRRHLHVDGVIRRFHPVDRPEFRGHRGEPPSPPIAALAGLGREGHFEAGRRKVQAEPFVLSPRGVAATAARAHRPELVVAESQPGGAGIGDRLEFHRLVEVVVAEDEGDDHQHEAGRKHDGEPCAAGDPRTSPFRRIGPPHGFLPRYGRDL